jgi:hypothetical protein
MLTPVGLPGISLLAICITLLLLAWMQIVQASLAGAGWQELAIARWLG